MGFPRDTDRAGFAGGAIGACGVERASITQETEILIEQGLLTERALGGPRTAALLRQLADLGKLYSGRRCGRRRDARFRGRTQLRY